MPFTQMYSGRIIQPQGISISSSLPASNRPIVYSSLALPIFIGIGHLSQISYVINSVSNISEGGYYPFSYFTSMYYSL